MENANGKETIQNFAPWTEVGFSLALLTGWKHFSYVFSEISFQIFNFQRIYLDRSDL
jgi:hypothetical protein